LNATVRAWRPQLGRPEERREAANADVRSATKKLFGHSNLVGIQAIVDEPGTDDLPSIPISSCCLVFTPQAIRGVLCVMPNRPRASSKIIPPWPLTRDSR